ncbi:MAG: HAMP domain-containing protein [Actinomycetales bacterium]|nr:HAMP domain-containing histidine kinase [Actinomycetota bacterium]MBT5807278.1 HAMP domain-containing histidine kinase [Actinomycetota bacterium]NCG02266.1 HAMP domain-containing protein [Actinomycetales bacterium]
MRFGLRTRVALAFGLLSLIIAGAVSGATYSVARWYLLNQREDSAITRAVLDSRSVDASLAADLTPVTALEQVPSVGTSQPMIQVQGVWYTSGVTVPPASLSASLLSTAAKDGGSQQRTTIGDEEYLLVAIQLGTSVYVEVFPLRDLDLVLTIGGWLLVIQTLFAGIIGVFVGRYTFARIIRPLLRLGAGARRIASGEFSTRIQLMRDPDLDPIAASFNGMAESVQSRIKREQRFSANVSHELRSPLTAVVGTAELLERNLDDLPEREQRLIGTLHTQTARMSQMLLDLLEISRIGNDDPLLKESVSVTTLCLDAVHVRGLPEDLIHIEDEGDHLVTTDTRRFERIVGNLIDNANRHGGGVTAIRIARISHSDPEHIVVAVEDAGPGIPVDEVPKLFEPFTRGEDAKETSGAGLGLAIAIEQAHLLDVELRVESVDPHGARFVMEIPVASEPEDVDE